MIENISLSSTIIPAVAKLRFAALAKQGALLDVVKHTLHLLYVFCKAEHAEQAKSRKLL